MNGVDCFQCFGNFSQVEYQWGFICTFTVFSSSCVYGVCYEVYTSMAMGFHISEVLLEDHCQKIVYVNLTINTILDMTYYYGQYLQLYKQLCLLCLFQLLSPHCVYVSTTLGSSLYYAEALTSSRLPYCFCVSPPQLIDSLVYSISVEQHSHWVQVQCLVLSPSYLKEDATP